MAKNPKRHPELEARREVIAAVNKFQATLEAELRECKLRLVRSHLIAGWHAENSLVFTFNECPTSPTLECIYDDDLDKPHDECLFCGEPEDQP